MIRAQERTQNNTVRLGEGSEVVSWIQVLRNVAVNISVAKTDEQVCVIAVDTLAKSRTDIPFVLLYLLAHDGKSADLISAFGVDAAPALRPPSISLQPEVAPPSWPLAHVARMNRVEAVYDLTTFSTQPSAHNSDISGLVLPIAQSDHEHSIGFLIAGVNAQQDLDDDALGFLELIAGQLATAITHARLRDNALQYKDLQATARREHETRVLLDTLHRTAPIGLALVDCDYRFVRVNEVLARINGLPADQHTGRTVQEAIPELAPCVEPLIRHVLETGKPILGLEVSDAPEQTFRHLWDLQANYYPVFAQDGRMLGVGIVIIDMTKRKRAEKTQQFLAQISNILTESLDYQTTLTNVAQRVVPYFADYCAIDLVEEDGTTRRVVSESSVEGLIADNPGQCSSSEQRLVSRVLQTGQAVLVSDIIDVPPISIPEKEDFLTVLRAMNAQSGIIVPLIAHGRKIGAMSFAMVKSCIRYTADDLALAEELALRVALTIDNSHLYHNLQAAVRARDEILSVVSHDLKSPLASIKGYAQLLQRRIARPDPPDNPWVIERLARIETSVEKMTAMIGEILDFVRLETGKPLKLDRQPVDLVALARQVAAEYQQTTDIHQISVETALASLVGYIDENRIDRVLENVLSNAIKYSPAGGPVSVTVTQERDVGTAWAILTVQDQGIGIPANDLPHIFKRFHRAANVGDLAGTGVGLSSAKQIVEQHGGTITVASESGVGTTITIRLPLEFSDGREWAKE